MEWVDMTASKISSLKAFAQAYRNERGKYPATTSELLRASDSNDKKIISEILSSKVLGSSNDYEFLIYSNGLRIAGSRPASFLLPAEKIERTFDTNGNLIDRP